ncbi:MAG: hypothetical protein LBO72_08495 [Helicobacteraceae bacterium]|jgi:hypothetical protein|nr:hypothetical protein [Helicobacteraceae bacterium]
MSATRLRFYALKRFGWLKLFASAFVALGLFGCYGGGGDSSGSNAEIAFYDTNLSLLEKDIVRDRSAINLSVYSAKYGVDNWYKGGEVTPISKTSEYWLQGDTNFYADANVTEIRTESDLKDVNASCGSLNKYIVLNDIALKSKWDSLCDDSAKKFMGTLSGNGYAITELWIDGEGDSHVGLFKTIGNYGAVKNLAVKTAIGKEINGSSYYSGAIAAINDGLIENVSFEGAISGVSNTGGIAGNNNGVISGAIFKGDVSGSDHTGGIAGVNDGKISLSGFEGNVKGGDYAGGIAGRVENGDINDSYSKGEIIGGNNTGGIVGYFLEGRVKNVYSAARIKGVNHVGGIAGYAYNHGDDNSEINNSYSIGNVIGEGNFTGGIAGFAVGDFGNGFLLIANSYSEGNIGGDYKVGGIVGGASGHWIKISNNAAINAKITATGDANRIIGHKDALAPAERIFNNFALDSMNVSALGANGVEGDSTTQANFELNATYLKSESDGGLGWRFGGNDANPWVWGAFGDYKYPTLYWQEKSPKQ